MKFSFHSKHQQRVLQFKILSNFFFYKIVDFSGPRRSKGADDLESVGLLARFTLQIDFYIDTTLDISKHFVCHHWFSLIKFILSEHIILLANIWSVRHKWSVNMNI